MDFVMRASLKKKMNESSYFVGKASRFFTAKSNIIVGCHFIFRFV